MEQGLIIQQIGQYVLKVKILGGPDAVELILRFTLSTLPGTLPFILTRKQFPVMVSFAMTISEQSRCGFEKSCLYTWPALCLHL